MIEFADAVAVAERYLEERFDRRGREPGRAIREAICFIVINDGDVQQDDMIQWCISEAGRNPRAWDDLQAAITTMLQDRNLPDSLLEWLIEERQGMNPRTAKRGRGLNYPRDLFICGAVALLVDDYGMRATRDGASDDKPCAKGGSACDAVGIALPRCDGMPFLQYQSIDKIWRRGVGSQIIRQ